MTTPETTPAAYRNRLAPAFFDAAVRAVYWPTSIARVRNRLADLLELERGMRVLEIGAGTGGNTEVMMSRGAQVTCVDRAPLMLARARQRAPDAEFVIADALTLQLDTRFDRALLALFLHEQESADRIRILERTRAHLKPEGLLVVADVSTPRAGLGRALWLGLQRVIEPPTALEVAAGALDAEIPAAGYELRSSEDLAQGRLRVYVARPA